MRTVLATLTTGIFVCLITSIGINNEINISNPEYDSLEHMTEKIICDNCYNYTDKCVTECELEAIEQKLFDNALEETVVNPNDINVIEIEEEIIIGNYMLKN